MVNDNICTNIDDLKQAQVALRIAAAAFETQDGIIVTDANKTILRVNNAFCRITGYSPEEVINQDASFLQSGVHGNEFYVALLETIKSSAYWQGEMWGKHKNGEAFPIFLTVTAVYGVCKAISHYVGSFNDITKRRQTDDALRIAAAAFETQDGMLVMDVEKVILRVNSSFTRMTGYDSEDSIGQLISFFRPGLHDEDLYRRLWAVVSSDGYWQGELWAKRKNGEIFPIWQTITAVEGADETITHYVCSFSDITLQKQAETVLLDAHKQLEITVSATQEELELHKEVTAGIKSALGVVIKHQGAELTEAKIALSLEVATTLLPFLKKLKESTKGLVQCIRLVDILEGNLKHLVNTYGDTGNLPAAYRLLTPVECQVASLVRQGLSTKAIAATLSTVPDTVSSHRKHIRQKLGLDSKATNLQSYLTSLTVQ